uniref:Chromo domain-containing protein n=1 Tax=Meloidogyne floridensis TaxID=298350 RepID=A0A915P259_9BILA
MDSIKSIIENNKIRGRSNEYENKYQGFKFMPDSDGKTRFMSSDGSIKIRSKSGSFIDDNGNEEKELRRSSRVKDRHFSQSYEFLNIRSRIIRKSGKMLDFSSSSPANFTNSNKEVSNNLSDKKDDLMTSNGQEEEEGNSGFVQPELSQEDFLKTQKRQNDTGMEDSDNDEREISTAPMQSSGSNEENRDLGKVATNNEESIQTPKETFNVHETSSILNTSQASSKRNAKKERRRYLDGEYIAEKILNERGVGKKKEYLIQWIGYSDQTWELASHFQQFTKLIDEFQEAKKNKLNDSNNEESDKNVKKRKIRQKRSYWHYLDSDDDEYEAKRLKMDESISEENSSSMQQGRQKYSRKSKDNFIAAELPPSRRRSEGLIVKNNKKKEDLDNKIEKEKQIEEKKKKIEENLQKTPEQAKDKKSFPEIVERKKRTGRRRGRPSLVSISSKNSEGRDVEVPEVVPETNGLTNNSESQTSEIPSIPDETSGDEGTQTVLKKTTNYAVTCGAMPLGIIRMRVEYGKEPELLVKYQGEQFADEWVPLSIFSQHAHQNLVNQFIFKFLFKVCNMLRERGIEISDVST